jgi:hypothetical protein
MKKYISIFILCGATTFASAAVSVSAPSNNSSVTSPVRFVATSTSTCDKGVSAMGIYTAPYVLAYTVNGDSLNTSLNLKPGTYKVVVQEWDNCGGATKTPVQITENENSAVSVSAPGNDSAVSSQFTS